METRDAEGSQAVEMGQDGDRNQSVEIRHDAARQKFVAHLEGRNSYLSYREEGPVLDLLSTFVAPEVRGRGVGEKLVLSALLYAKGRGLRVIPTCWFVDTVVERHAEFQDLLTER